MAYTYKHGDRPVDGYTIQRAVGRGGFGEVYYAVSDGGREVAIKYLRDNPQIELRGVSNCINLKSPYLVAIFDVKKTVDDDYAIIMEYCSGPSLRDLLIAEPNGFDPQKAAFFLREIGKGLAYLHDRGIVHRDLKPGNIFYDDGYAKIGDYGLSKFISVSRHSGQTASVGTVHYMAPEIGSGNYSKGVDIYALGVMLYEMLLAKVPFEGSSMAEVLMKHLTAQPELDHLPQPFGSVIRKALQKDPKDRYQSVDEMIEAILEVDAVRESLAGFSLKSLDGAVRYGEAVGPASPMPSPNPPPHAPPWGTDGQPPYALPVDPLQSPRTAKRMDRVARKMEKKMAKLGGRPVRKTPPPIPAVLHGHENMETLLARGQRGKRMLLTIVLSIGLAYGLGILVGNTHGEEAGVAAGLLVVAMSGSLILSRKLIGWFGVEQGPNWAQMLVRLCICTPLVALGAAPIMESKYSKEGIAVWLGLAVLAVLGNWTKHEEEGAPGDISFGTAIWKAISALIFTAIAGSMVDAWRVEDFVLVSAGVAGAVSLITQAMGWWLATKPGQAVQPRAIGTSEDAGGHAGNMAPETGSAADETVALRRPLLRGDAPNGYTEEEAAHLPPGMTLRWGFTRAFWGVAAFMLMGGAIFLCLFSAIAGYETLCPDDRTGAIIGCVACFTFMMFALRKVSPLRRIGFWVDSVRPFLLSLSLFGVGATITGLARTRGLHGEEFAGLITGLTMCSLIFLTLLFFTGRKRKPRPFLQGSGTSGLPAIPNVVADPKVSQDGTHEV
jgi:hypothetical protein